MPRTARDRMLALVAGGWLVLAAMTRLDARETSLPAGMPDPSGIGRPGFGEGLDERSGRADQGDDAAEEPGRLDPIFDAINPARLQRLFDRAVGLDPGDRSRRPRVPEIGEPVFFDLTRPLGDREYANELNYLLNPSTGNAPTLQVIEYEYTFADWRSAELDLSYFDGRLEILTPFYQRTLGVGRRRNWVHGYQVSPDLYLRSGFVGGSAVYVLGWKPEEESRFSSLIFLGANRALIGGFRPGPASMSAGSAAGPGDRIFGSWRPEFNLNLFYKINEKFTIGIEDDLFFQSGKAAEYLAFPFLTYEAGKHAFFQVGGGYYHFESRDQFTFLLHLNFVNPSPRQAREERGRRDEPDPTRDEPGRLGRFLGRLLGDR